MTQEVKNEIYFLRHIPLELENKIFYFLRHPIADLFLTYRNRIYRQANKIVQNDQCLLSTVQYIYPTQLICSSVMLETAPSTPFIKDVFSYNSTHTFMSAVLLEHYLRRLKKSKWRNIKHL